ncbi:MAG TPA: TolC family protein [Elusimicrobiota bacterium]|nr:TolC family protein [Elusimicrobiota bacterium]
MISHKTSSVLFFAATCFLFTQGTVQSADWVTGLDPNANIVETISVEEARGEAKVMIQSAQPLKYKDIRQTEANQISIYFSDPVYCQRGPIEKLKGKMVSEIRYGYPDTPKTGQEKAKRLEYILIKLTQTVAYTVTQKDWILAIDITPRSVWKRNLVSPEKTKDLVDIPKKKPETLAVLPANPSLDDFLNIGLSNYGPLKIAREELKLSKIKLWEARRTLLPSVTGKYELSNGTMLQDPNKPDDDSDFRRKEIGVQGGQPIFQSGRLYYSLRQASSQRTASEHNVEKARQEIIFEVKKAYYNLIKTQNSLKARRDLMTRCEKIIQLIRKKKALELVTEVDLMAAESNYSQISYRTLSDDKDHEIARLKMMALLNIDTPLPDEVAEPIEALDARSLPDIPVPVNMLLEQAYRHRPDWLATEFTAMFHEYGEKATKAEGRLRIDASGFVGKSGGAFQNQELQLRSSWNVGVQAKMSFMGNSLSGSGTSEKTSPDLGETSRTKTSARTANVGLLDGLTYLASRKQAYIGKEKARMEQEQTRRNVEVEVKEAFFNYEKARLQLMSAQKEYDYRKKDLEITRQKDRMNLAEPLQVLQSESSFTEAVSNFEEAVAFYRVSLATIEKSIGIPIETIFQNR